MADNVNITIGAEIQDLLSKLSSAGSALLRLGGTAREVQVDFDHLTIDWDKYTIAAQNADNETVKFISTTNGLSNVFSRVRNELEAIEVAWDQALVEDSKRAQKAIDDLNKSLENNAKAEKEAAAEAEKLGKAWDAAIVENGKRAEKAAAEASQANLQAANAFRSPWQAVSAGLRLVESEFGLVGVAALGATVAVVAIAGALYELVATTGKAAIETDNLASRLGITDQQALKLQASSELAGISAHAFETNIRFLVEALDAGNVAGQKTLDSIHNLGVRTIEASGAQREMGQVFLEIIDKLSKVSDVNKQAAEEVQIFHRNAMQIQPLIKYYQDYNAAVGDLGIGVHKGLTEALAAQGREVIKLGLAWENFKNEAAFTFGPAVAKVLEQLQAHLKIATIEVQLLTGNFQALKDLLISMDLMNAPAPAPGKAPGLPEASKEEVNSFNQYIQSQLDMKESLQERVSTSKKLWEDELKVAQDVAKASGLQSEAYLNEKIKVAVLRAEYVGLKYDLDAIKISEENIRKVKQQDAEAQRELNRLTEENIRSTGQVAEAWRKADEAGRSKKEGPELTLPTLDNSRSLELAQKNADALDKIPLASAAKRSEIEARGAFEVKRIQAEEAAAYEEKLNKQIAANDKYYAELQKKNEKVFTEGLIVQDRDLAAKVHNWTEALNAYNKYQADLRHAADEEVVTLIESNNKKYAIQKAAIEEQFKLFQITPKQRATQESDAAQKTFEANRDAAQKNVTDLNANPDASKEEIARAEKRLEDIKEANAKRLEQINAESVAKEVQLYDKAFGQIQGTMDKFISATLAGHQKIGQSLANLGRGMIADVAKTVANIGLMWAKMELGRVVFHQAANNQISLMDIIKDQLGIAHAVAAETTKKAAVAAVDATGGGADVAAGAAKNAAGAPARIASVQGDAAVAAAAAAAWTAAMGAPEAAPEAGAAMYALIAGLYTPLAAFEQGGLVPDNQLAFLHKNEMVLPANISKGVQGMINGGSAGGRQLTLHYHGYQGQSNESMKMDANMIGKHVKKLARQGRL
jgi:hypothetical protein